MIAELRHLPAPAKLNLFLHVLGRRGRRLPPDLETVFELIDLSDRVHLRLREDGVDPAAAIPCPAFPAESDLTVRAARLLAAQSGCRLGVEIDVRKRIPMGGGLGGGSSDAATVLLALNRMWSLHWPRARLARPGPAARRGRAGLRPRARRLRHRRRRASASDPPAAALLRGRRPGDAGADRRRRSPRPN